MYYAHCIYAQYIPPKENKNDESRMMYRVSSRARKRMMTSRLFTYMLKRATHTRIEGISFRANNE